MPFVSSYANTVLNSHIKSTTTIGLFNASGVELTNIGGYARAELGTIDTSKAGQVANAEIIFMFEATSGSGTATSFALFNGSTKFFTGDLNGALPISDRYVPLIRAHELIIGLDVDVLDTSY